MLLRPKRKGNIPFILTGIVVVLSKIFHFVTSS